MIKAYIQTPWRRVTNGTPEEPFPDTFEPELIFDYPLDTTGERYTDVTGQLAENVDPSPNIFVLEVVLTEAKMSLISTDPKYYVLSEETI